jgi:hypothetical protein
MVHIDRIKEEIRVLRIKDRSLLSSRVFENFNKRISYFEAIRLGLSPDKSGLSDEDMIEFKYLKEYFDLLQEYFPDLSKKWSNNV